MRKRAGRNDHAIFSRTAVKTKRINLPLTNSRGGADFNMAKFIKPFAPRNRVQQDFDRTKITYVKCGKEINIYDEIQANRVDTEIIPTLRKYGNLKPLEVDYKGMYGEFQKMDLRDVFELKQKQTICLTAYQQKSKHNLTTTLKNLPKKHLNGLKKKIKTKQPTTPTNEPKNEGVTNE